MERKRCPACGSRINATAAACDICGHVFGETRAIPKAEIEAAIKRKQANNQPRFRGAKPLPAPRRRIPWGVIGVMTVLLLLVGGSIALLRNTTLLTPVARQTPELSIVSGAVAATPSPPAPGISVAIITPDTQPAPTFAFPTRTPLPPREHRVISGDTCGSIAQRYSIPLSEFMRYNQLSERSCLTIQIGDILLAPPPTATPGPTETPPPDYTPPPPQATLPADFVYEVKRGDSCSTIAQALGISVDDIIRENSSLNQQCLIVEGQKLNIRRPGAANTVTYAVTPAALLAPTRRTSYEAPGLLSPVDNSVVTDPVITLEWLSVGILRSNEWYVVQIQPSGALTVPVFETKSTSIRLTANLLGGEPERTFAWWVQVRQKAGEMSDGAPIYNDVGPASGVRRFTWQRPIPTSTPPPTP